MPNRLPKHLITSTNSRQLQKTCDHIGMLHSSGIKTNYQNNS